jgi:hypothetical protein
MWTAVLVLATAVNFEPTRIGLIGLMLSRPRPMLQLLAFMCGCLVMSASVGLLVLFVVHHGHFRAPSFDGSKAQVAIGLVALLIAALLATNLSPGRFTRRVERQSAQANALEKLSTRLRGLVQGSSPWFSGAMGVSVALPSIDYLALLVLIAASGAAPTAQAAALLTFLVVANAVAAIPLASYVVAPARTRAVLEKLHIWVRARTRRDYAVLVAVAGCVMIAVGISGL